MIFSRNADDLDPGPLGRDPVAHLLRNLDRNAAHTEGEALYTVDLSRDGDLLVRGALVQRLDFVESSLINPLSQNL